MTTRALALLILVFTFFACAHKKHTEFDFKVRREVLPNGLTVLFVEDRTVPVVSYTTWVRVGSSFEKAGASGIAHLFEHMMFKGTKRFGPKEFFRALESRGAIVNAYTNRDATVYYEVIPSEHLELVMDMESDRLANLVLTQADLDAERQVVKEERRLRVDSNFGAQQMEALQALAFGDHPYGRPIIGFQEDLERLTLEECTRFFKTYYQPGNLIITIAGDFEYEKAKQLITRYYGGIKGKPVPELKLADWDAVKKEKVKGEKRQEIFKPVEAETLMMAYYIPSMYHPDAEKLSMLAWALFGMSSSRATVKLVREKQVALNVGADASLERFPYLFLISVDMKRGQSAAKAEAELESLIEDAKKTPLAKEELERVKNRLIYSTVNEAKSPGGVANWLAGGEFYWKDYHRVYEMLDRYHAIGPEDLREVARKYLNKEARVVTVMKPAKKEKK